MSPGIKEEGEKKRKFKLVIICVEMVMKSVDCSAVSQAPGLGNTGRRILGEEEARWHPELREELRFWGQLYLAAQCWGTGVCDCRGSYHRKVGWAAPR